MKITKNKSAKYKYKYPLYLVCEDSAKIPVPKQQHFKSEFIRKHGCSLVGVYIGLRWMGKKWTMGKIKRYADKHLRLKSKYPLTECYKLMHKVCGNSVVFYHNMTEDRLKWCMENHWLVILEEKDPIHTVCLANYGKAMIRISSGGVKVVTVKHEIAKRSKSDVYRGAIVCKRARK